MAHPQGGAALSDRLKKFGVLGSAIIPDSLSILHEEQSRCPVADPNAMSREELARLLEEQIKYTDDSTKAIGDLAHSLATQKGKVLTFVEAHKKILELGLSQEPLEALGITEKILNNEFAKYAGDEEIETLAAHLIPKPPPTNRPPKQLTANEVMDVHDYMAEQLSKIIRDLSSLSQDIRHKLSQRTIEIVAELMVSIAVEKKFDVRSEDVELSLIECQDQLGEEHRFQNASQQLQQMMTTLLAFGKPKLSKDKFEVVLNEMSQQTADAKKFMKNLYNEYEAGNVNIVQAYEKFVTFADNSESKMQTEPLMPIELRSCYDAYKNSPEIQDAWERSGQETQIAVQMMMMSGGNMPPGKMPTPSKKLKKLKINDIIQMQELMVEDLKKILVDIGQSVDNGLPGSEKWRDDLAIPLIQGLASASVEKRFSVNAEEMTLAGFLNAAVLSTNEKFLRATMEQQQILSQVPKICKDGGKGCGVM